MKKLLFFDYRELEHLDGFTRAVEPPVKHPDGPLLAPDLPWEHGNMQLYGSVIQAADGRFRAWYQVVEAPWITYDSPTPRVTTGCAGTSLSWTCSGTVSGRPTSCSTAQPAGPAVIEDRQDPRPAQRYKLMTAAAPSACVAAFHSADGIHWESVRTSGDRIQPVNRN